jgi:hypothetical protein
MTMESKPVSIAWLCPADFAAWLDSGERRRCVLQGGLHRNLMDFIARRKAEILNGTKVPA